MLHGGASDGKSISLIFNSSSDLIAERVRVVERQGIHSAGGWVGVDPPPPTSERRNSRRWHFYCFRIYMT